MATPAALLRRLAGLAERLAESLERSPIVPIEDIAIARKYGYVDVGERRRVSWQRKVSGQDRAPYQGGKDFGP